MDAILQNRFEGSIFFVYDRDFLQKEEDRLEDAIIYFYPESMPMDNRCRLCGQLMGLVQFSDQMFNAYPVLFRFDNEKIAVKHVGRYSFALAGSSVEPDSGLLATVDRLYFLFAFYHGSIDQVKLEYGNDKKKFERGFLEIWGQYLPFIRNYYNILPSVFNPIPYLHLKDDPNFHFLKASHILESCQRRPQIIAGAVLYSRYILCSQLTDPITRCLLLLKPNQQNPPALPIETEYQLPFGVRLFHVYLSEDDLKKILESNENSPYQSCTETPSCRCCCSRKRTTRPTPSMPPCTLSLEPKPRILHADELFTQSEKDPLSSSCNSGSKRCKAMLEDLILKGFKCCKCVDGEDMEDGTSLDESVESVINLKDDEHKSKNGVVDSTQDLEHYIDTQDNERRGVDSRNSALSQNSAVTVETESGIEVTGSDFHSSAATHLDQRSVSASLRDGHASFQENCDKIQATEQCTQLKTNQDSKEKYVDSDKHFGFKTSSGDMNMINCKKAVDEELVGGVSCNENIMNGHMVKICDDTDDVENMAKEKQSPDEARILNGKSNHMIAERKDYIADVPERDGNQGMVNCNIDLNSIAVVEGTKHASQHSHRKILHENIHGISKVPKELRGISEDMYYLNVGHEQTQFSSSEDSYRTPDELLETEEPLCDDYGLNGIHVNEVTEGGEWMNDDIDAVLDGTELACVSNVDKRTEASCESGRSDADGCKGSEDAQDQRKCCEVDGLIHANLFVQAHSEVVLILLAKCDLHQNEDAVRSLWSTTLSQLGELDILMKNCAKQKHDDFQGPLNLLIYDNFDKKMSGNYHEPVYARDHVFCDTAKTLHNHFNNAPQLSDVTLRNFHTGIYGERTLSREAYFQETRHNTSSSNAAQNASGYLAQTMRECIVNDHGLPCV